MSSKWLTIWSAPSSVAHFADSGRDAVAITFSFATFFASWMPIDPTPPAPPTISTDLPSSAPSGETPRRSNSASHAVMVVSGSAAAQVKSSDFGFAPTIRSSTRWNSLFAPGRVMLPA